MAVDGDLKKRGPYIFQIPYTIEGMTHEITFQCSTVGTPDPGTPPIDIEMRTRNGEGRPLADMASSFWALARAFIPAPAVVAQFYLKRAQAGTDKLFYVASGELGMAGNGGPVALMRQMTLTFRTANSSVARLVFLEGNIAVGDDLGPLKAIANPSIPAEDMAFWVTNPLSPVLGTDASWIVAPLTVASTQNEALYRARKRR